MGNNIDLSADAQVDAQVDAMMHYEEVFANPTNFYKGCVQEAKYFYETLVTIGVLDLDDEHISRMAHKFAIQNSWKLFHELNVYGELYDVDLLMEKYEAVNKKQIDELELRLNDSIETIKGSVGKNTTTAPLIVSIESLSHNSSSSNCFLFTASFSVCASATLNFLVSSPVTNAYFFNSF
jgi:hypothetical protein